LRPRYRHLNYFLNFPSWDLRLLLGSLGLLFCSLAPAALDQSSGLESGTNRIRATRYSYQGRLVVTPEIGASVFRIVGARASQPEAPSPTAENGHSGNSIGVVATWSSRFERVLWSTGFEMFQAGAKQNIFGPNISSSLAEIETRYFGVPIRATYLVNKPTADEVKWYLAGSLKPSVLVDARVRKESELVYSESTKLKDQLGEYDLILGAGFGPEYTFGAHTLELNLAYQRGTQQVIKGQELSRNEGLTLRLGYVISL